MASGVVKVGRRAYAVGLLWQPSPSGRVAQAAREAAQQPGQQADFYCVRAAGKSLAIPQYGLAQSSAGHKAGLPTLAASLANVQPGSWAGAFRLREGTWVVVVRDDLVAPDGDTLFDNDDVARDRLMQEVALGGVQRIYAPDGWAVPGSDPTPLPLLLQDRTDCRLQPVHLPMRLLLYAAGAIAVVALLIFLALQWQAQMEQDELERAARDAKDRAERGVLSGMTKKFEWPPAEELYKRKWEEKPVPAAVVDACRRLFMQVPVVQLGWKRGASVCQANVLSIQWLREKEGPAVVIPNMPLKDDLSSGSQTIKADLLPARGPDFLGEERDTNARALAMNWPVTITRLPDEPPPPPPANIKDPPPPPPAPWRMRGVKYNGKTPPWEIWRYFDGITGMVVDKISWDNGNWTLEATIYEKRGGQP